MSPYDRQSYDSNDDLDLPELNDRSYVTSDASHREDFERHESSRDAPRHHSDDDDIFQARHDDVSAQSAPVPFMQRAEEIVQEVMQDFRLSQSDASSSYDEVSDVGEAYDDFDQSNTRNPVPDAKRPPVTGKSLFTQEEFSNQHHSLAEFEKVEAELERRGAAARDDDDADVIGAYLQGNF